jgi:hypothetical protein
LAVLKAEPEPNEVATRLPITTPESFCQMLWLPKETPV